MLIVSSCNFFENHTLFSNDVDTLLAYSQKLDSSLKADAIKHQQEILKIKLESNAKIDSLQNLYEEQKTKYKNRYHIIVGAFKTPEYALNYSKVMSNKGYNSQIIMGKYGFRLVSICSFSNLKSTINELRSIRDSVEPDSWVFVRK